MDRGAFQFRMAAEPDLQYCLTMLPDGLRMDPALRRELPKIWHRLFKGDAKTFAIVEDINRPYPDCIEGFGFSVFVTDAFADEFIAQPRPFFPTIFYKRFLEHEDIVADAEQLADANAAEGINVAVLHFGLRNHDVLNPRTREALMAGGSAFFFFHTGYKVRTLTNEVYGRDAAEYVGAGGLRMLRDFQKLSPPDFADMRPEHYPYLYTLRREEIAPGAINPLSQLFHPPSPRVGFSRSERQLLERSLLNQSDAQIADTLGVTPNAVKKTWTSVYTRISRQAPALLPSESAIAGIRGEEKKRRVLHYVRTHLEELRPYRQKK